MRIDNACRNIYAGQKINFNTFKGRSRTADSLCRDTFERKENKSFAAFLQQINTLYPFKKPEEILAAAVKEENAAGSGCWSDVYFIPEAPDYVLKVNHNIKPFEIAKYKMQQIPDEFPFDNFGQKIADNGRGAYILKKADGVMLGFKNPGEPGRPNAEDAQLVLAQIKSISQFPIESYINLASDLKKINQSKTYRIDFSNANNMLIDYAKKEFNIVDLTEKSEMKELKNISHDVNDMISLLVNVCFHGSVYEKLPSNEEKEELKKYSKMVINKCREAAKAAGLNNSGETAVQKFEKMNDYCRRVFGADCFFVPRYENFRKLYEEV